MASRSDGGSPGSRGPRGAPRQQRHGCVLVCVFGLSAPAHDGGAVRVGPEPPACLLAEVGGKQGPYGAARGHVPRASYPIPGRWVGFAITLWRCVRDDVESMQDVDGPGSRLSRTKERRFDPLGLCDK